MESFTHSPDDSLPLESNSSHPFDDNFLNYDNSSVAPPSHNFTESDSPSFNTTINNNVGSFSAGDDVFSHPAPDTPSSPPINGEFSSDGDFRGSGGGDGGPILPPPAEMGMEEGLALREWRKENAIRLEEKEKREKEILNQIISEAEEFKVEFYRKGILACQNNKAANREKEKLFLANKEKFHDEADKDYWKSIAELIPKEVPAIEKKRGKKDQEKKPSVLVIQGPKPGKPTDLSRMRHILLKLKHDTPPHLKLTPPPLPALNQDAKSSDGGVPPGSSNAVPAAATAEPVAAA